MNETTIQNVVCRYERSFQLHNIFHPPSSPQQPNLKPSELVPLVQQKTQPSPFNILFPQQGIESPSFCIQASLQTGKPPFHIRWFRYFLLYSYSSPSPCSQSTQNELLRPLEPLTIDSLILEQSESDQGMKAKKKKT